MRLPYFKRSALVTCASYAALGLWLPDALAANTPLNITFRAAPANANSVSDNFLGISWELVAVHTLWGETPQTILPAMKNYMSNIRQRMTNSLRMRIGGTSMDSSTYDASQPNMVTIMDPNAYFNNIPTKSGPLLFDVMNALSDAAGSMQFIIGLSMQDPANDKTVLEMAAAATSKLGNRLDAMTLGNEPDLYAGHGTRANYTISDYIPEVKKMLSDLENSQYGNLIPKPTIAGPTTCCSWNLSDVLDAGLEQLPYKYYTIQHYPNHVCGGPSERSSNISFYLDHANISPFLLWNNEGMRMAKQSGVPVALTEFNSASCGGDPSVAPTFAALLWAVDVAFKSVEVNYSSIYLHTREFGITYNLFDPPTVSTGDQPNWRTGSPYYAMLVVAETLANTTTTVVDLNIANSSSRHGPTVAAYGVYDGSTREKSKLVLLNFDYPRGSESPSESSQTFNVPANLTSEVGIRYLVAPNITEQTNISWAGQTVQMNGVLEPAGQQVTQILQCSDGCSMIVPGPGLVVVWLDPDAQGDAIFVEKARLPDDTTDNQASGASHRVVGSLLMMVSALSSMSLLTLL